LFADLSISESEQEMWMEKARAECKTLTDIYWSAIKAVAAILLANYRMNGTDVEKAVSSAMADVETTPNQ
jgi:hypothetical protein